MGDSPKWGAGAAEGVVRRQVERMGEAAFAECKTKNRKPQLGCGCGSCLLLLLLGDSIYASCDVCNPKVKPNRTVGAASRRIGGR